MIKIERNKGWNLLMTSDPLMKGKAKAYIKAWACSRANEQVIKAYIIIFLKKNIHYYISKKIQY